MTNRITCPACQTLLSIPSRLAGKVLRCPRCKTALPNAEGARTASSSEAITARPDATIDLPVSPKGGPPVEREEAGPDAWVQLICETCGAAVSFAAAEMGTVQECPECCEFIDVPDLTSQRYERQLRETDRQLEQTQRQLDRRDRMDQRTEAMIEQAGRLLARWEAVLDRFERSLALWEQQRRTGLP
jgi:DNA-directed RNA polymerase subunit M/transcription elongation factor TFIIS